MEPLRQKDPKTIGPYTLIGRLGAGGMGIVYLASKGSESVALKVVRESLIDDPSDATRFAREIEALEAIDSPYVAKILGSGVEGDQAWFATEFVNGPDLKSLVSDKGPLDKERWQLLAEGVLTGLEAIHSAGVIHRDIKPGNIIMSETGPKIIDFGIAQVSDATSVTSSGLVAGSPAWFSPEQIEGQVLTPATDLFSAGSVLVYAATGSSPWGDETTITKASVFKILTAEPELDGLSGEQRNLVEALMAKDPEQRRAHPDSREVRKMPKVSRVQAVSQVSNHPPSIPRLRLSRKLIAIGVVGLVVILGGVVGVVHIQPATGSLRVHQYLEGTSINPVIGDLTLRITRNSRIPVEIGLGTDTQNSLEPIVYESVSDWQSGDVLTYEIISSYSADKEMKGEIALEDFPISGLIREAQIFLRISVTNDEFEVKFAVPQLSGGKVRYEWTEAASFPRLNEKADLASCKNGKVSELRTSLEVVTSLNDKFELAYSDARLDVESWLTYDVWASRIRRARDLFRPSVDAAAAVGNQSWGEESLDSAIRFDVSEAQSHLDELSSSASWTAGFAYGGNAPEDQWDAMWQRIWPWDKSFGSRTVSTIGRAAETICAQEIE